VESGQGAAKGANIKSMSTSTPPQSDKHALVLSGGGARAAYQVGALRYIAKALPDYRPQILTGISAGAINAAHLAAHQGSWAEAVSQLSNIWLSLDTEKVYATGFANMARRVTVWGLRLISGGRLGNADVRGMVDNSPLREFLRDNLPMLEDERIAGIQENIARGVLESLAIITTNYGSGRSVAWVEGNNPLLWERGQLRANDTQMRLDHIMASSALPMFFPAVRLESAWHGDGGVRLTAPLSPALHLGATRILAVSPRAKPVNAIPPELRDPYPSPAQIASVLLNAVFLDMLDYDALQMNRINRLVSQLAPEQTSEFRQVEVMVLRPREDLGKLAQEHEITMPSSFRFFERGLHNKESRSSDALSMVMFEPEYLALLIRLGEEDAAERRDEIEAFLRGGACSLPVW